MPSRAKRLLAALWSVCKSIDLEACLNALVHAAGHVSIWYGCWLIAPAYGYIVVGVFIVVPRIVRAIAPVRRLIEPMERA